MTTTICLLPQNECSLRSANTAAGVFRNDDELTDSSINGPSYVTDLAMLWCRRM
jgi:hypothetical protein